MGLSYALLLKERPRSFPKPKRATGSKAKGLSYEKKLVRHLMKRWPHAELQYHRWIRFQDSIGVGHAEPELYVELADRILLLECKLTGGPAGRQQLELYYKPLLEHIYKKPVYCLLVCKNVIPDTPRPRYDTPEDFVRSNALFGVWVWRDDDA